MGKKVREYQAGDFIFAKVKGYPAWPARVHKPNGKKYLVYFYGTGETANLSPNMIFDYAENKDKFLTKTVKRRDFNDGVKQIEHDFANNVPLEQVIGIGAEPTLNTTQNDAAVEDSDDTGNLVIDEGKTEDNATLPSPAPKKRRGPSPTPDKEKEKTEPKEKVPDKNIKQFNAVTQSELEDLKEPFKSDVNSKQENLHHVSQTKIIPTFGKKKNLKKNDKKSLSKPKKFVPPIKSVKNNENSTLVTNIGSMRETDKHLQPISNLNQDHGTNVCDTSFTHISQENNNLSTFSDTLCKENDINNSEMMFIDTNYQPLAILHETNATGSQENTKVINKKVSLPKRMHSNKLGSIISSAINVLEDEETLIEENFENLTQNSNSDRCSVKSLSQNQNLSFCSVTSLSKTYKNLDCNSFKSETHRIPQGEEFLNLFKNDIVCGDVKKGVAMSTEYGDIGFNLKYSDYIKNVGEIFDRTDEEKEIILKIVNMYPNENKDAEKENILIAYLPSGQYVGIKLFQSRPSSFKNEASRLQWDKQAASNAVTLKMQLEKGHVPYNSVVAQLDLFTPLEGLSFWEYFTNRVMRFKKATSNLSPDELLELIHEPLVMSEPASFDMKEAVDAANETEQKELIQPDGEDKNKKKTTPAKAKKSSSTNNVTKTPVKRQSSRKLQDDKEKDKDTEESPETEATTTEAAPEAPTTETTPEEQEETTKPQEEEQKVDEQREKTPEKTTEEVKPVENEKESTEENGDLDNGEKAEEVEKEKKEKEDVGEPRAKRSRENKKTEPPPPRSPAKRKSKV
ncbi:hypothetical protein HF086_008755 [Spodoptera exigua]|uniref:PWWP domain-containing protein n=1 Tax=Spodoptera exigua TaxID=7107 RepID=A0A922MC16_SPOEX|nr:hypothetical protein HF086_008755 [Spodoptera exigua]